MRFDRWRWLAPIAAALLLLSGAAPALAAPRPSASCSTTAAGTGHPVPDDAVRAGLAERADRGAVVERASALAPAVVGTVRPPVATRARDAAVPHRPAGPRFAARSPRAPPGPGSPIPS